MNEFPVFNYWERLNDNYVLLFDIDALKITRVKKSSCPYHPKKLSPSIIDGERFGFYDRGILIDKKSIELYNYSMKNILQCSDTNIKLDEPLSYLDVLYVFEACGGYVIRLRVNGKYASVFLDGALKFKSFWYQSMTYFAGDKGSATRIDMICGEY